MEAPRHRAPCGRDGREAVRGQVDFLPKVPIPARKLADKEIQRHGGIYEFLLSDRTLFEKLDLRAFDPDDMRVAYENLKGVCPICKGKFAIDVSRS